ncbi:MAG: hypothetical protein Q7U75_12245, partial [Desulfobacterales bacterium]|nr:hypothetical protein [Desulfobacterales bacterium]
DDQGGQRRQQQSGANLIAHFFGSFDDPRCGLRSEIKIFLVQIIVQIAAKAISGVSLCTPAVRTGGAARTYQSVHRATRSLNGIYFNIKALDFYIKSDYNDPMSYIFRYLCLCKKQRSRPATEIDRRCTALPDRSLNAFYSARYPRAQAGCYGKHQFKSGPDPNRS